MEEFNCQFSNLPPSLSKQPKGKAGRKAKLFFYLSRWKRDKTGSKMSRQEDTMLWIQFLYKICLELRVSKVRSGNISALKIDKLHIHPITIIRRHSIAILQKHMAQEDVWGVPRWYQQWGLRFRWLNRVELGKVCSYYSISFLNGV